MASIATDASPSSPGIGIGSKGQKTSVKAMSPYFKDLDPIRSDLKTALGDWQPPVVIVFGAESAGKSTILERISMFPLLPKGSGICTRLPILVCLRSEKNDMSHHLTVEKNGEVLRYDDVETEQEVLDIMEHTVEKENGKVSGISKTTILKLMVRGPHYPDMDLLDLPGLKVNPGPNEPATMERDTHELLDTWIEKTKGRAIYLAIRQAGTNVATSQAHRVLSRHGFMLEHTIGVLTKCDDVKAKVITRVVNNKADVLNAQSPHKYVATSNPPAEKDEFDEPDLEGQADTERLYFEEEGLGAMVENGQATCDALVSKVCDVYGEYLFETWIPTTYGLLKAKEGELQDIVTDFGAPVPQDSALPDAVIDATTTLINKFVDGQLDSVVENVIIPLEKEVVKLIEAHAGPDEMKMPLMDQTLGENGEGTLVDALTTVATAKVGEIQTVLEEGLETILRGDVAGRAGGTTARIGRFEAFLKIIVAKAKSVLEEKTAVLKGRVREACQASVRKLAAPTYNWEASSGRIVVDAKAVADSIMRSIVAVAARPVVDGAIVASSVAACTVWEESCAEEREKREKELRRIRGVLLLELFQRHSQSIVDWDAVERVVGKDKADQMKQGEGFTGTLDICKKQITDEGCKILAPALRTMPNLETLNLSRNNIGDEGCRTIAPALRTMPNLKELYLGNNNIGDEGCRTIAPALRTMPNLKELNLSSNNIGDEGCRTIAPALRTMPNLKELLLSFNNIGDEGLAVLSNVVTAIPLLEFLVLQGNKIGNVGCQCLLELVEKDSLQSLTVLWLQSNPNISSEELKTKFKRVWREKKGKKGGLYF